MRGSLGLSAYRTLSGRRTAPDYAPSRDRPRGEVVWIHAAEPGNNRAINDLAHRLAAVRFGCHIMITAEHDGFGTRGIDAVWQEALPPDHPITAEAFVAHWAPDVVIWAWGGLRPNIILSAADQGAYMLLVDTDRAGFDRRRDRWLPEVPRTLLACFSHVMARDRDAHLRLAQLGRALGTIELCPALHPFGRMLPVADSDMTEVSAALAGRPTWLAALPAPGEWGTILSAHLSALKRAHRLLLIVHVGTTAEAADLQAEAQRKGLRTALWGQRLPDENTQVLLCPDDGEDTLGLWLRAAPVTFLGGTLQPAHAVCDPYCAAAHGTAVIYGPNVGVHVDAFTRLMNAGAARIVNDADSLGRAVSQIIAPDQSANMAMAGWDVVTQGADSLDRIIELTQAHLDAMQDGIA
ncbi:MAG: glycosyltransferase N-terminal domain-containing protein [Pseudomonadota bacterium]